MTEPPLTPEETDALKVLAQRNRLMAIIVPKGVSDEFCMRLQTFISYLLDVQLMPALPVPAVRVGDGMSCPYCHVRVNSNPASYEEHTPTCEFRQAIERWAMGNIRIDQELKG